MKIDWSALGSVFGVSLVVTVGIVTLFTLGVMGLSRHERAQAGGGSAALAVTGAYACFAACLGAVAYGISLIVA
ncbi:hypothetical protein [Streptomyces acidiscabies]|uniref:Uncharacterized protein n=1 Tax=Streptomyces acidiscabies TaxID=42234 RepID=A0AAP6B688_9ACTN|nr:hypothetical protein [Streptomyces acidiscabies]MBP5940463.1 hypothetical protein [Streptomyces sp. LBUM 1476]MBZ3911706.1 hypothetical protein [Streptomyces acidiscabies]MDX2958931.1 hypothetical protein [Streptomyces acidiscabies]MDX3018368.1 hypothetical protein [Streptomyces acidiscabies]MDX3794679.1 hypothetical protein [Streptomyces acidiscabies]